MTNHQLIVVATLAYIVSSISFLCTITTLVLIKVMKKWNGFLLILWSMALCQLIFDVSFSRHITSDSSYVSSKSAFTTELWDALQFFGGLSVSLWTNVLAVIVAKVVVTYEGYNIRKNFYKLCAFVLIPSIAVAALNLAFYDQGSNGGQQDRMGMTYTYARTLSIVINFIAYGIIAVRAQKMQGVEGEISPQQMMINELSRRMIYYPLMQTVSRIGASIYEPLYGYGPYLGHTSNRAFGLACLYAITAPAAGIGYLIIFLAMQPYAYEQFISILTTCRPVAPPEKSVSAASTEGRKYSDALSDSNTGTSLKTPGGSSGIGSSSGGGSNRGRGSGILSRVAAGMGRSREESVIKYLDDDELLKAIKESGRAATRRDSITLGVDDRGSAASSMQSSMYSMYSRGSELTAGSASLSTHITGSLPSSSEWNSVEGGGGRVPVTMSPVHSSDGAHIEL